MTQPTLADWHAQYLRQARWTQATRNQLYRRANLLRAERVLDVGCGTGVLTKELARRTRGEVTGLDIDPARIAFAREQAPGARNVPVRYEEGDVLDLSYPKGYFGIVACHFLLLWVADPERALREMARVTRPGGYVLVCAEPDYGGRVDWPELPIGEWQREGLRRQGADPLIGRRLRHLLGSAGLRASVGVLPSLWDAEALRENFKAEWTWLAHDVGEEVDASAFAQVKSDAYAAVKEGTRLVYLPIFYAMGRKVAP
jgi:ubiquinone/menaquinone biosynthesis C-methylase UbiE